MPLRGELLNKPTYAFLQTRFEGNTGGCYKYYDEILGEPLVQKTISLLGLEDAVAYNEPRVLQQVRHENLAQIRDVKRVSGQQWAELKAVTLTMPYYQGQSVHEALENGYRFSLGAGVGIAAGMLAALHYLHAERKVLHRDIKPANVLLDKERRKAFVGDLVSATFMDRDGRAEARSGSLFYRPPEYASGALTAKSDVFGVGMVLFEMVNGAFPYDEFDSEEIQRRVTNGRRSVSDRMLVFGPHVPRSLVRSISSMIAKDPAQRPADAETPRRALLQLRYIDWVARGPSGSGAKTWTGTWPPQVPVQNARVYRVQAEPITAGQYRHGLRVTAAWRRAGASQWRDMPSLDRQIQQGDESSLRAFFSEVNAAAAQQVAAT
jgi:serine/threonine protein kinase